MYRMKERKSDSEAEKETLRKKCGDSVGHRQGVITRDDGNQTHINPD